MESGNQRELLSSLISDIKNYNGEDPLRPWLQGIRKMKESLPPHILKEKLPRFLQKCAQAFESDRRYRNDSRYLRVWIQLMDYVDDARVVLRKMEKNGIGLKRAMFYSAYALYYEKRKKFADAEKMYRMGVQNLAEPAEELQKSYEQFLHRMNMVKKRKTKDAMPNNGRSSSIPLQHGRPKIAANKIEEGEACQISLSPIDSGDHHNNVEHINLMEGCSKVVQVGYKGSANCLDVKARNSNLKASEVSSCDAGLVCPPNLPKDDLAKKLFEHRGNINMGLDKPSPFCGDDTVVVKFVGSAIVGKSEAEDACHHGLVDPTVNMKEAMNAISSMFREPLEVEPMARRRSHRSKPKENQQSNGFEVFVDESLDEGVHPNHLELMNPDSPKKQMKIESQKPFVGAFKIWTEDDDDDNNDNGDEKCCDENDMEIKEHREGSKPQPNSLNSSSSVETNTTTMEDVRLKEDTAIRRFVGSTVFGEPEVENACHHGLVDPTVNLKEAMDDINSMFGKPLNFVKANRPKKQAKTLQPKPASHGFSILADDDVEEDSRGQSSGSITSKFGGEGDLFEPTVFTREAMADINEMFGKPLDF